jgi:hypothetical protein
MRRGLSLSTFARFYLVIADGPGRTGKREIYVAFDPLRPGDLKALEKATTGSSGPKPLKIGRE